MKVIICQIFIFVLVLEANDIQDAINKRNLFENQKEVFRQKEEQKSNSIIHYDTKKPELIETNKEEKCFEIDEIVEENFYSLSNEDKKDIYNKYINKCNTIEDLINLTNELTSLYINEGLITSKVYLKPQNIQNKKLLLSAMEGKIDKIISSDINVKNSFFFLEDKVLNLRDLEVGIENLNRLQSNNASLDIKPSAKQGYSVVEIENKATSPLYGYLTYNNFGTEITGKHQIGASVGLDNMLHINDSLLINYNTTNKHKQSSNSKSTYINYSFPIGRLLYTLSYSNSTYNQEIPVGNNIFIASGDSNNYTLDLNYKAFHNQNHKLNLGTFVNYYTTENLIDDALIEVSSYNLAKVGFKLSYIYQVPSFTVFTTFSQVRGVDLFNSTNPTNLDDKFKAFIFDGYLSKTFDKFQYSLDVHAQRSSQELFSVNQISIGGPYSVRGFNEEGLDGNSGYYYRNELSYSMNNETLNSLKPYAALDGGWIKEEQDTNGGTIIGGAVGVKLGYEKFYCDLYLSKPLKTSDVKRSKSFFGVNVSYNF